MSSSGFRGFSSSSSAFTSLPLDVRHRVARQLDTPSLQSLHTALSPGNASAATNAALHLRRREHLASAAREFRDGTKNEELRAVFTTAIQALRYAGGPPPPGWSDHRQKTVRGYLIEISERGGMWAKVTVMYPFHKGLVITLWRKPNGRLGYENSYFVQPATGGETPEQRRESARARRILETEFDAVREPWNPFAAA